MKITWSLIIILLLAGLANNAGAGPSNVLIVNTDNSVARYREIATEFRNSLQKNAYQWQEYDLRGQDTADSELQQLIQSKTTGIIFCIGTKAYSLARNYSKDKKLVFSAAINWRRLGIDDKTYGVSNELTPNQEMSLLRYFLPAVKKIGVLFNGKYSREYLESIKQDAKTLGIVIIEHEVNNESEIGSALETLLPDVDICWLISDPIVLGSQESVQQIFQSAKQFNKPVYSYSDIFIAHGAVLSVSADIATIGRQAANLAILMDTNQVSAGTVQIPAGSMITINKCTIDNLHLKFNQDALDSVNKIVDCKDLGR